MSLVLSSIKSKTFSSNLFLLLFCFLLLLAFSSCSRNKVFRARSLEREPAPKWQERDLPTMGESRFRAESREAVKPPWQTWSAGDFGSAPLSRAEELRAAGRLTDAVTAYLEVEQTARTADLAEEAVLRRASTLLQLGRSSESLAAITAFLKNRGQGVEQIQPRMALVASFAYEHQGNTEQKLAWLKHSYQQAQGRGPVAERARKEALQTARRMDSFRFTNSLRQWEMDPLLGPVFSEEQKRRLRGGVPDLPPAENWFSPVTYQQREPLSEEFAGGEIVESESEEGSLPPAISANTVVVGALLPLSGQFAEHAKRVQQGIDLAVRELRTQGRAVQVLYADTQGSPEVAAAEYDRLVQNNVSFVFGPLLLRTTEFVAKRSEALGVPILTFTKRSGIPRLAPTVFRLGVTAKNQVEQLVRYSVGVLGLSSFGVLYPETETGREFAESFQQELDAASGRLNQRVGFLPGNPESMTAALETLYDDPPQAVFFGDSLVNVWPMLELIQHDSPLRNSVLMGPAAWDDPVAIRGFGSVLKGALFVTPFHYRTSDPQVLKFIDDFKLLYGSPPGLLSAQAFDATFLVLRNLHQAPKNTHTLIRSLHYADIYNGVTGLLSVKQDGEVHRQMSVVRLIDGEPVEVVRNGNIIPYTGDLPASGGSPEENSEEGVEPKREPGLVG